MGRSKQDRKAEKPVTEETSKETKAHPISEVAEKYGVTPRTLRYYEQRGLLTALRQGLRHVRCYDDEGVARLEIILKGKHLGFTLSEIEALIEKHALSPEDIKLDAKELETQIQFLEARRDEIDAAISELRQKRARRLRKAPASS